MMFQNFKRFTSVMSGYPDYVVTLTCSWEFLTQMPHDWKLPSEAALKYHRHAFYLRITAMHTLSLTIIGLVLLSGLVFVCRPAQPGICPVVTTG
jgi:hypothetical protein